MSPLTEAQPQGQEPGRANGKPQDALDEFVRAVRTPVAAAGPDPKVAIAFAAGWHAAEAMHSSGPADAGDEEALRSVTLAGSMLRADLARLGEPLAAAEQDTDALREAIDGLDADGARGEAAAEMERRFGAQLMAADYRLGKAFMLGCRLAKLRDAAPAEGFDRKRFAELFKSEHEQLHAWVSQLATALPANAGHSVRDSLDMWAKALEGSRDLADLDAVHVHTQIEAWRTLLSGEKAGRDTLELPDYVGVAEGVADQIGEVVRRGLRRFLPLVLLAVLLLVGGIVLIVVLQDSAGVTAGIATVLTTAGLTWKGLGGSLGRAVAKVEQPAWAAQVDRAIAYAITKPLPEQLLAGAAKGTLLHGLREWRHQHPRPADQGVHIGEARGR